MEKREFLPSLEKAQRLAVAESLLRRYEKTGDATAIAQQSALVKRIHNEVFADPWASKLLGQARIGIALQEKFVQNIANMSLGRLKELLQFADEVPFGELREENERQLRKDHPGLATAYRSLLYALEHRRERSALKAIYGLLAEIESDLIARAELDALDLYDFSELEEEDEPPQG